MLAHNILVVDDEEFIRANIKNILLDENYNLFLSASGNDALEVVKKENVDLALLDLNLPDMNGIEILKNLKKIDPELLVIIITGYASVESAVEALKLGAYDYIKKPFKADAIKLIIRLALETQSLKEKVKELSKIKTTSLDVILGESEPLNKVKHQIEEFSKYDSETVLITGESGSGKELVAKSLHNLSPRNNREFLEVNCASIPETLLESELFGYEKGAFTDAKTQKKGLLEKADKGTLFLDEIGEMSPSLQAKLLRVLENKKFRRLGGTADIEVNLRIIAATNKNLKQAIEEKEFREDLYYRLNVLRIEMPPLRERGDDILLLAQSFLDFFNKKFKKQITHFTPQAQAGLLNYSWPGNVRELKNIIERICILQKSQVVEVQNLPGEISHNNNTAESTMSGSNQLGKASLDEILYNFEVELLTKALESGRFNISQTARILKIPRETLRYKLSKYGLQNGDN
ncbi:MAG: sigma-54-dependent Fis family transcriptional regulator [Calditrichaeota bacterium]|nr:sigma-54-dependent Fis family transcriptional regulator [Calditrichota bacterium]